jgi:hypothetical protein
MKVCLHLTEEQAKALLNELPPMIRRCSGKVGHPPRWKKDGGKDHWLSVRSSLRELKIRLEALQIPEEKKP